MIAESYRINLAAGWAALETWTPESLPDSKGANLWGEAYLGALVWLGLFAEAYAYRILGKQPNEQSFSIGGMADEMRKREPAERAIYFATMSALTWQPRTMGAARSWAPTLPAPAVMQTGPPQPPMPLPPTGNGEHSTVAVLGIGAGWWLAGAAVLGLAAIAAASVTHYKEHQADGLIYQTIEQTKVMGKLKERMVIISHELKTKGKVTDSNITKDLNLNMGGSFQAGRDKTVPMVVAGASLLGIGAAIYAAKRMR